MKICGTVAPGTSKVIVSWTLASALASEDRQTQRVGAGVVRVGDEQRRRLSGAEIDGRRRRGGVVPRATSSVPVAPTVAASKSCRGLFGVMIIETAIRRAARERAEARTLSLSCRCTSRSMWRISASVDGSVSVTTMSPAASEPALVMLNRVCQLASIRHWIRLSRLRDRLIGWCQRVGIHLLGERETR